jgi:hypothetical protein
MLYEIVVYHPVITLQRTANIQHKSVITKKQQVISKINKKSKNK